ncbi:MAG: PASTA domain-containing protein [Lentimicrobiaceae bacterium]|jgi:beta-lactam-binding protein with PASTA domain|nr:PASTA domain-containing protein [Lentimicrobiaceae bacterium]
MGVFSFLTNKKFYIHLFLIILVSIGLFWSIFYALKVFTRHDEVYLVPELKGNKFSDAEKEYQNIFNFILIDSIYVDGAEKGIIVQQDPLPNSKVKKGRNIYCVIVAIEPERTIVPNLHNLSLRQAIVMLETAGLVVENLVYVDHFARNAVIAQHFEGKPVESGAELYKGSKIQLVLGNGNDEMLTAMPNLIGVHYFEVADILHYASLNVGKQEAMDADTLNWRVYQVNPNDKMVPFGTKINLVLCSDKRMDFDNYLKEIEAQKMAFDSTMVLEENLDIIEIEYDDF